MQFITKFLIFTSIISWGLASCVPYKVPDFDQIVFRYSDSSIPPKYHRSYTITLNVRQCTAIVDVYGKNIANKTYMLKKGDFNQLKTLIKQIERPGMYDKKENGSSSNTIMLINNENTVYQLLWDNSYTPETSTQTIVKAIEKFVPDLDKLLKTPYGENMG